jgi:peroxisomal enoyl-CoA hydratase 2
LPFKGTSAEIIDFYASQNSKRAAIPDVPKFDSRKVVHGEQAITFLKHLPPTSEGRDFEMRAKVLGVYDKGKPGSVVETENLIVDKATGEVYSRAVGMSFFVGQGNWNGPKGEMNKHYDEPD